MTARKSIPKPSEPPKVKTYRVGNTIWDYPEGQQPDGAEEVTAADADTPVDTTE